MPCWLNGRSALCLLPMTCQMGNFPGGQTFQLPCAHFCMHVISKHVWPCIHMVCARVHMADASARACFCTPSWACFCTPSWACFQHMMCALHSVTQPSNRVGPNAPISTLGGVECLVSKLPCTMHAVCLLAYALAVCLLAYAIGSPVTGEAEWAKLRCSFTWQQHIEKKAERLGEGGGGRDWQGEGWEGCPLHDCACKRTWPGTHTRGAHTHTRAHTHTHTCTHTCTHVQALLSHTRAQSWADAQPRPAAKDPLQENKFSKLGSFTVGACPNHSECEGGWPR